MKRLRRYGRRPGEGAHGILLKVFRGGGSYTVEQLERITGLPRRTIYYHLRKFLEKGLVEKVDNRFRLTLPIVEKRLPRDLGKALLYVTKYFETFLRYHVENLKLASRSDVGIIKVRVPGAALIEARPNVVQASDLLMPLEEVLKDERLTRILVKRGILNEIKIDPKDLGLDPKHVGSLIISYDVNPDYEVIEWKSANRKLTPDEIELIVEERLANFIESLSPLLRKLFHLAIETSFPRQENKK